MTLALPPGELSVKLTERGNALSAPSGHLSRRERQVGDRKGRPYELISTNRDDIFMNWNAYCTGVNRGLPVGVGYFSVSFGFGAMAAAQGIKALDAALISLTNLTSAGQFAGLTLIVAAAGLWEMILTQVVINSRYALMSLALSQKMG